MKKILFSAFLFIVFFNLKAQEFSTKSVALFKDGNAFFIKKGSVSTPNKTFLLKDEAIPQATLGSLWFYGGNNPISSIRSFVDTLKTEITLPASTDFELLYLNKGKKVTIVLEKERIEGVVEDISKDEGYPTDIFRNGILGRTPSLTFNILTFKTTDGRYINLHAGDIKRIEFTEKPIAFYKVPLKKPINVVSVNFEKTNATSDLEAMYVQKGLRWNPFYHLQLLDDKKAQITLRAEISNDAENLKNIDMSFVVGIPNFLQSNSLTDLVNFLNIEKDNNRAYYNRNNLMQNGSNSAYLREAGNIYNPQAENNQLENNQLEGNNIEDLYFYKVPNFSLNKGEKAHIQLFTHQIKYEHVYECNLPDNNIQNYNNYNFSKNDKIKVFHSAKLYNETTNPFTTGSCLITQKKDNTDFPLGQDMLNYTSKKGNSYVKITETPDIKVTHTEKILERSNETTEFWGRNFYKVLIEGKIKISSFRNKETQMELRHKLTGIAKNSSTDWRFSGQEITLDSPNLINLLCWDFKLKPSEVKEITYQYEAYVYK